MPPTRKRPSAPSCNHITSPTFTVLVRPIQQPRHPPRLHDVILRICDGLPGSIARILESLCYGWAALQRHRQIFPARYQKASTMPLERLTTFCFYNTLFYFFLLFGAFYNLRRLSNFYFIFLFLLIRTNLYKCALVHSHLFIPSSFCKKMCSRCRVEGLLCVMVKRCARDDIRGTCCTGRSTRGDVVPATVIRTTPSSDTGRIALGLLSLLLLFFFFKCIIF